MRRPLIRMGKSQIEAKNQNRSCGKGSLRRELNEDKIAETLERVYGKKDPRLFHTGVRRTFSLEELGIK